MLTLIKIGAGALTLNQAVSGPAGPACSHR